MITYNDIYEATRKERYSDKLQLLSKNFVEEVAEYLKDKKEMTAKQDDIFSDIIIKTKKQLENAVTLFNELMLRRRKKILALVLIAAETGISKQDFENMLGFERALFEEMMKCMDIADKQMQEILNRKKQQEDQNSFIIFKTGVEEFMDLEGGKLGPFEKGQMANIPKDIAKILIDDGKAEMLEK